MKEKVVLAYSGGLDTTAIIPWLKENFDYEVICCCIDCGQGEELDGLEERAKLSGASKLYIENIIDSHPDVSMSCVIGIPHPYKVEVAKAFIVLKDNAGDEKEMKKSIRKHCEENLAKYSWPAAYEFRKELPKTLVGKIAYTQLEQEESENVR